MAYRFKTLAEETTFKFKAAAVLPLELEFEAARNTVPDLDKIFTPADGGPDAWLQLNVEREGTQEATGAPAAPSITVARLTDTSARVTFTGAAGYTAKVRYATYADGGETWLDGGSGSGNCSVDVAGLTAGVTYLFAGVTAAGGVDSEFSNIKVFTAGPATTAAGAYAVFLNDLYAAILASATLAGKITDGLPTAHVKLGRALNTDGNPACHDTIIAAGPVIYIMPTARSMKPHQPGDSRGDFAAAITICEAYDQSASNDLLTATNFVDALLAELFGKADGLTGTCWLSKGGNVSAQVEGPMDLKHNELETHVVLSATVPAIL